MSDRIRTLVFLFPVFFAFGGCAVQSAPEGGAKDVEAPQILHSDPENYSLHFNSKEIEIQLSEYVSIVDFNQQFFSSPPLKHEVEYSLRGRKLTLELTDTLRPHTTYTFSFGNAIRDITEGNQQTDFKYVFATGAILDTQRISGNVLNAFSGKPSEKMMVGLYPAKGDDSIFMKELPQYYALSDVEGKFAIENVAPGEYRAIAFRDRDFNYKWTGSSEELAFHDSVINSLDNPYLHFSSYKSKAEYQYRQARYADFGRVELYFSAPAQGIAVRRINSDDAQIKIEFPENGDTVHLWTTRWMEGEESQWEIFHAASGLRDTARVMMFRKDTSALRISWPTSPVFTPSDSVMLESNMPIDRINPDKMIVLGDSLPRPFNTALRSVRQFEITGDWQYGQSYTIILNDSALRDLYGRYNDSISFKFSVPDDTELSILHYTVRTADDENKVLELFNEKGKVLYRSKFTRELSISLVDILPEKFNARVIIDKNQNGQWDPGQYFEGIQPEQVIYSPKKVELRANWELDETWVVN